MTRWGRTTAAPSLSVVRSSPRSNAYSPSSTTNPSTCSRCRCGPGPPSCRERIYVRTKSGKSASTLTVASGTSTRYFPARDFSAQAVERPLQAFVELDLGLPAELFTRARGVERDVLDLAGAFGGVFDLEAVGRELVQH